MRRIAIALLLAASALVGTAPAGALSCMPPDPIDWEERFPRLDAALIVQVEAVKEIADGTHAGSLEISAVTVEVLKGNAGERLSYVVPSLSPWGPYYEVGAEVAAIIENGHISDGRQNICGPWFEPSELRRAAEQYGDLDPPPKTDPVPEPTPERPHDPPVPEPPNPAQPGPGTESPAGGSLSILSMMLELILLVLGILGLR